MSTKCLLFWDRDLWFAMSFNHLKIAIVFVLCWEGKKMCGSYIQNGVCLSCDVFFQVVSAIVKWVWSIMSQNNSARWREQYAMQLYVLDYVLYFKYLVNCVKQLTVVSISSSTLWPLSDMYYYGPCCTFSSLIFRPLKLEVPWVICFICPVVR